MNYYGTTIINFPIYRTYNNQVQEIVLEVEGKSCHIHGYPNDSGTEIVHVLYNNRISPWDLTQEERAEILTTIDEEVKKESSLNYGTIQR